MGWLPAEGEIVLGKYRIVRRVGRGGMGVVYEAENLVTDGRVALKVLSASAQDDANRSARMTREARAAAKLKSRFVARIFDFDHTPDNSPVLIMELLKGHDLSAELRSGGALPIDDALSYVVQACAGVAEAHALGIIHRDLKPGNLFLDRSTPATPMVRVLDFGLSKVLDNNTAADLTNASDALGTLAYMSPEQMRTAKEVDARTDVWALGVILYRALMGTLPLEGEGLALAVHALDDRPLPRVQRADVPPDVVAIVACALEKKASRRFADARALGVSLAPFIRQPGAMTKLAFDELGVAVSAPVVSDRSRVSDPPRVSDRGDRPPAPALRFSSSRPPPPRRRGLRLPHLTREARWVLAAAGILVIASIAMALSASQP